MLDRYRRDWLWHGTAAYTAGIGLAALRAAEELAKETGDSEFADWCRQRSENGRRSLEENLWNNRLYRLYTDPDGFRQSDTSFLAALGGQAFAWLSSLGDLSEQGRILTALHTTAELHGTREVGEALSGMLPDGKPDESGAPYSTSIVPRDVWLFAAAAVYAAERTQDTALRERALAIAERAYTAMATSGTLWRQHSLYRPGDMTPAGDPHYFGNLAVWMLPYALEGRALQASPGALDVKR
jgi:uncharacterized protein (DUF608 family)